MRMPHIHNKVLCVEVLDTVVNACKYSTLQAHTHTYNKKLLNEKRCELHNGQVQEVCKPTVIGEHNGIQQR